MHLPSLPSGSVGSAGGSKEPGGSEEPRARVFPQDAGLKDQKLPRYSDTQTVLHPNQGILLGNEEGTHF